MGWHRGEARQTDKARAVDLPYVVLKVRMLCVMADELGLRKFGRLIPSVAIKHAEKCLRDSALREIDRGLNNLDQRMAIVDSAYSHAAPAPCRDHVGAAGNAGRNRAF